MWGLRAQINLWGPLPNHIQWYSLALPLWYVQYITLCYVGTKKAAGQHRTPLYCGFDSHFTHTLSVCYSQIMRSSYAYYSPFTLKFWLGLRQHDYYDVMKHYVDRHGLWCCWATHTPIASRSVCSHHNTVMHSYINAFCFVLFKGRRCTWAWLCQNLHQDPIWAFSQILELKPPPNIILSRLINKQYSVSRICLLWCQQLLL